MDSVALTAQVNAVGVGRRTMTTLALLQMQLAGAEHTIQRSTHILEIVKACALTAARNVVGVGLQTKTFATLQKGPVDVLMPIQKSTHEQMSLEI